MKLWTGAKKTKNTDGLSGSNREQLAMKYTVCVYLGHPLTQIYSKQKAIPNLSASVKEREIVRGRNWTGIIKVCAY